MRKCGYCDGSGSVPGDQEMGTYLVPCPVCEPNPCISCGQDHTEPSSICRRCRNLDTTAEVCEAGRPLRPYPLSVSHLMEGDVTHHVPQLGDADVLHRAVITSFYERTLPDGQSE